MCESEDHKSEILNYPTLTPFTKRLYDTIWNNLLSLAANSFFGHICRCYTTFHLMFIWFEQYFVSQ